MPPIFKLLRPHQWSKNAFIFAGLIFDQAWGNPKLVLHVILITCAFCLTASAIYILNDFFDQDIDRLHPVKKNRPLAQGSISPRRALLFALFIGVSGLILGFAMSAAAGWILITYVCLNIAYSMWFKYWPPLDVVIIASGFLLRVLAGTYAVGIMPSKWLLVCTLMLTLFLGFCKRRGELQFVSTTSTKIPHYSKTLLDKLIIVTAVGAITSYTFYALHQDALLQHNIIRFVYTVPIVIYGIFRYCYLLQTDPKHPIGIDMAIDIFYDRQLLAVALLWLAITMSLELPIK